MSKKIVAVLFGGQSSEHEVSCISASTIIQNINRDLYDVIIIGITKEGKWLEVYSVDDILSGDWTKGTTKAIISPDATQKSVLLIKDNTVVKKPIDVVFPVLHGLYGEDGTIQGLLELAGIPYVGCGVVASGISMDKLFTKIIVKNLGIDQAKYVPVHKKDLFNRDKSFNEEIIKLIEASLKYPMFVKPANAGSSCGISKVNNKSELIDGLIEASNHDKKILVEEGIVGREIECAVLGGKEPRASGVGEIIAAAEFYDYDAKYNNSDSRTIISPALDREIVETVRQYAIKIFNAVDGYGLARVDFFVEKDTNRVVFNEINTMPGFTSISMYPMLWEARGIGKPQLVEKLIQLALNKDED
ncbi:MAG: D-alanine--D-alanine ligase [Clostridiales bacterium]|nr:D-alanine--D-alanine ligase [Clostridiales bacterium]